MNLYSAEMFILKSTVAAAPAVDLGIRSDVDRFDHPVGILHAARGLSPFFH